ncbi:DEAD/DEAH box helicase [Salipiger bermudensis]|nr:DEAD/DEAH box helicase [Salipiger bermudensis]
MIDSGNQPGARELLVRLLDEEPEDISLYTELLNELLISCGLTAYTRQSGATWWQRFNRSAFTFDVGAGTEKVLHRPQAEVLLKLLKEKSLALSAPTSFGKSFIIDSFISIRKPKSVLILVPTISLMDEFRRRLTQKFSDVYDVITTVREAKKDRFIYILPQERAVKLIDTLDEVDLLVVDEFYKISSHFDQDRSPSLVRAILNFKGRAKQSYFLTPNISSIVDSPLLDGVEFVDKLNFNTVFLNVHDLSKELRKDPALKASWLVQMLSEADGKTLVYAGTFTAIDNISKKIIQSMPLSRGLLLKDFADWLEENYSPAWLLPSLVRRGCGVHNGKMHRSLAALQVQLFEEEGGDGLSVIVSTSSIIEGVNTSAKNIVVWQAKNGNRNLKSLSFKNLIGRGGRMFKHFVGHIYLLEKAPKDTPTQLEIDMSPDVMGRAELDSNREANSESSPLIASYISPLIRAVGSSDVAHAIVRDDRVNSDDMQVLSKIVAALRRPSFVDKIGNLNSSNAAHWKTALYEILNISSRSYGARKGLVVPAIQVMSRNWSHGSRRVCEDFLALEHSEGDLEMMFKIEKEVSFNLAALISDIGVVAKHIGVHVNTERFATQLSHCFLPSAVHQIEEFGLPRVTTRLLLKSKVISQSDVEGDVQDLIDALKEIPKSSFRNVSGIRDIEIYMIESFLSGVSHAEEYSRSTE